MISSNTRATRSRYSSPAHHQQNGNGKGNGNGSLETSRSSASERTKTFMEKWLEPSVQNKPSFEEAGLMRYGVLETMAPLGALPKSKKGGQETGSTSSVRKIILRPSGAGSGSGNEAASSPGLDTAGAAAVADAPTTSTSTASSSSSTTSPPTPLPATSPVLPPASAPAVVVSTSASASKSSPLPTSRMSSRRSQARKEMVQVDEDGDGDPKELPPRRVSTLPSLPPRKGRPPSSVRRSSLSSIPLSPVKTRKTSLSRDPPAIKFAEKVVEAAVDEALHHYRYPTAWALRTLYDEKSGDASFVAMVEDVFNQTADASTKQEFSRQIEKKKREGKKDNKGCYYFVPPTTNSRFAPHKPLPGPYAQLVHREEEPKENETRASKKIKVTHSRSAAAAAVPTAAATTTPRKSAHSSAGQGGGGGPKHSVRTPSSRKRTRRHSGSSESSLSSAISLSSPEVTRNLTVSPTPAVRKARGKGKEAAATPAAAGASSTISTVTNSEPQSQSSGGPRTRPITTRGKSLASSKHQQTAVSNTSRSNSPTSSTTAHRPSRKSKVVADDASMPGRLAPEEPPVSRTFAAVPKNSGHQAQTPDAYQDSWDRRKEAQTVTNSFTAQESFVRNGEEEEGLSTPARSTRRSTRQSLNAPPSTRATRSARKRPSEIAERTASPVSVSHQGDGSSVLGSRAVTPINLPPAKKHKTGLRVKLSPVKRKGGTAAGVPRPLSESQSSMTPGAVKEQASENDECCSACGNVGDVVCCDGCPRSFHFECVDMDRSEDLPDEWYCNECLVTRYPSRVPVHKGVFASALNLLEKSIPRAFSLPKKLQNRFEGVKAGADGDYEDVITNRAAKKKNNGYEEAPDFFRQRDEGEAVICHACQKPATQIRAIIPCSVCTLYWHTDCLDPPLAVPPVLKTWRCPAHADDLLAEAPPLAPAHRFRRLKGAQTITPALPRGLRNNGHIEIDWTDEQDENNHSGWKDYASFGRTYKIPAQGVVLDFIEKMQKHNDFTPASHDHEPRRMAPYLTPPVEDRDRSCATLSAPERSVDEMQASLIMASLQKSHTDGVEQLTSALLASAEPNVISLIAKGNAANIAHDHLASTDKLSLRALLVQMEAMSSSIRQLLGEEATSTNSRQNTTADDIGEAVTKVQPDLPVAEPTPPSTIVDHNEGSMDLD